MPDFLKTYPFLLEIPADILQSIDLEVLHIPSAAEQKMLDVLSTDLKKNVVIYKKSHVANGAHLCRVLQFGSLTTAQLDALNHVENLFPEGHVVVAYEKPLTFASGYKR